MQRARAFGIDIQTERSLLPLPKADATEREATRVVTVGSLASLDRDWPTADSERIEDARDAGGVAIASHPAKGFRIEEPAAGVYRVSPDGLEVQCGFSRLEPWDRQRFLCSRVLPLAATLRGRELLHAGCVGVRGGAIAFVGPTGAGKSSLTLQMVLLGATFLTDDLLAVEVEGGPPMAHPGLALAGVRYAERDLLRADDLSKLRPIRDDGGKVWVVPERAAGGLPLRVLYVLARDPDATHLRFEDLPEPDPRLLMGASFFPRLEISPARLTNHLAVSAAIALSVPVVRVVIPAQVGAARLADRILAREGAGAPAAHAALSAP